jgi:hypothetical protein
VNPLLGEAGRELDELRAGLDGVVPALLLLRVLGDSEVLLLRELGPTTHIFQFSVLDSSVSGSMTYWCGSESADPCLSDQWIQIRIRILQFSPVTVKTLTTK